MKTPLLMNFTVDRENRKIRVEREFAAPLERVWAAWTESNLLDQWWAPKPWQARTKFMDFKEGGHWLYSMVGPGQSVHWCRADYQSIVPLQRYSGLSAFCDEQGNINPDFPRSLWTNRFTEYSGSTLVTIEIGFQQLADLEKNIELGFREGFTAAMENLDGLIAAQII